MSAQLGIIHGLSFSEYVARPGVSVTKLKEMRRSPKHYRHALLNPRDSAPFALGRAAHCALLEPDRFASDFVSWTRRTSSGAMAPRTGQHWEAFTASNAGKEIVTEDQYSFACAIAESVRSHAAAMKYLRAGSPEVSMFWRFLGMDCRGRIDWLHESADMGTVLVGLKTTRDIRSEQFGRQAKSMAYDLQWGSYGLGWQEITGRRADLVVEICVEPKAPHDVGVYVVPDDVLQRGADEYMELLETLAECQRSNYWPGALPAERVLVLPTWGDAEIIEAIEYAE
jgi:hypothetical protein